MKAAQWVRLVVLSFAVMSVAGLIAVLACGPSAPSAPPNGAGNVSDSVSLPTEVPFMLPQSGDGGNGEPTAEPTEEPTPTQYVPPTVRPSECKGSGSSMYCPPDGDPKVGTRVRGHYNRAMNQNVARGVRGDAREFPELPVIITTHTSDAVDDVVEFLEANGVLVGRWVYRYPGDDYGVLAVTMDLSLIPELVALAGVRRIKKDLSHLDDGRPDPPETIVESDLQFRYFTVLRENKRRGYSGDEALPYPVVRILIETGTASAVEPVLEYLRTNGGRDIVSSKVKVGQGDLDGSGTVEVDLNLMWMPGIMWIPDVDEISEVETTLKGTGDGEPASRRGAGRGVAQPAFTSTATATSSAPAELTQADQWHRAGYTGAGVQVAVLDSGFNGFKTNVLPMLSEPVHYLCFSGGIHPPSQGILLLNGKEDRLDTGTGGGFSDCEIAVGHGTAVVASLLEIAPDVELYVSNASKGDQVVAVRWLKGETLGSLPRSVVDGVTPVDRFDVKVINHSGGSRWDGPGDGTSPFDEHNNRSLLNIVDDVVADGVLWVNAAGNHGAVTWFKYDPRFTSGASRLLDFSGSGTIGGSGTTCNSVYLKTGEYYVFQLRWWDLWPGADTDLDLLLYPASGSVDNPLGESDGVDGGTDIQSGSDGSGEEDPHYAREVLEVESGRLTSGYYCLAVKLNSGSDANSGSGSRSVTEPPSEVLPSPVAGLDWVQLQVWKGAETNFLSSRTNVGSLTNPAESDNDGMLSVGFVYPADGGVDRRSARGPAPWERNRQALDLVSDGTHPFAPRVQAAAGSSGAAPRVAGLASLVIQALGDRDEFDEPSEIAQYMKEYGSTVLDCVHDWGCGFAILPPLDLPENVMLEATSGICGRPFPDNVGVTFDRVASKNPDVAVPYYVEARKVGDADADSLDLAGISSNNRNVVHLPGRETYVASVRTCLPGVSGEPVCGKASISSNELLVPREVCRPAHFDLIPGQGIMTLRWDAQLGAVEYVVERVVDGVGVEDSGDEVTDQHYVFTDVPSFVWQSYRVRAVGLSGESSWSNTLRDHTGNYLGFVLTPRLFQEYPFRNRLGEYDAVFGWLYGGGAALQEVQVREVGTEAWTVLSSDPEVARDGPRVIFTREVYQGGNFGSSNMYGVLTGLVPGTEYQIRVRGVNGDRVSAWTGTENFNTSGRRPAEGTDRPPVPAVLQVMANASDPFSRVVLGWDAADGGYLHEIRIMGGGLSTWGRLPHQPSGWSSEYSVLYPTDGQAFITGLIPGTEYRFAVRAAEERDSSIDLDHSSWSNVVSLTTPGVRPATAPGAATAPLLKAPAKDLMAVVNGTTVDLSWTVATNPNYVRQVLLRRVFGVNPIQWTEIDVGLNDTTYSDTGLTGGVTYRYRVRSYKQLVGGNYGESGHAEAVIP